MRNRLIGVAVLAIALSLSANAGEFHSGDFISCSDCHTTHYSERGTLPEGAEPGGPFPQMLLVSSTNTLCLSCHDGTDPDAPDVLAPVTMYDGSGSEHSAAGFFIGTDGIVSVYGHDLGVDNPVPYATPPRSMTLSCASCHNPHGSSNYRNLISDPDSSGVGTGLLLDTDIFENINPANPPERNFTIEAYKSGNIGYKSNMTQWCADCHTSLQPDLTGNPPAHFLRHPSEVSFIGPADHIDSGHWISGTGEGFGIATGDAIEGIPRLRFQAPNATDYNSSRTTALDNEVFCTTCHLAHGGQYESSLVWPFERSGEEDLYSGCQQCHYK